MADRERDTVMGDRGELEGSLLKMLTEMCDEMPEKALDEMSGQWAEIFVTEPESGRKKIWEASVGGTAENDM